MSAFMVCKSHIDQLVSVAYYGPKDVLIQSSHLYRPYFRDCELNNDQLNDLGEMFVKENLYQHSLAISRHSHKSRRYTWTLRTVLADALCVQAARSSHDGSRALKAISCYEYQSCEHPEWKTSQVRQYCEQLRRALIGCLPGYESAPWEWGEIAV
jgi:hypothetical protein